MFRQKSNSTEKFQKKNDKLTTSYNSPAKINKNCHQLPKIYTTDRNEIRRQQLEPFKNFFVIKENKFFSNRIQNIRRKPVKPNINTFFIETEERLLDYKQRVRLERERVISLQNQRYREGVFNQSSLFGKFLGKEFQEQHQKLIMQLTRSKPHESYVLPPIKKTNLSTKSDSPKKSDKEKDNNIEDAFDMKQQVQGLKQSREVEELL